MKEKIKTTLFFILSAVCGYACGYFAADNRPLGFAVCMLAVFIIVFGYAISAKIYTLEGFPFFCGHTEVESEETNEVEPEKATEENENTQAAE